MTEDTSVGKTVQAAKKAVGDVRHPIWSLIRLTILMATLIVVLMVTASKFDYTEIRTIIVVFVGASGIEAVGYTVSKINK